MLEECKEALLVNNCTVHSNIEDIKLITLYFPPPNTTSCSHSVDQGIIQSLQCKCSSRIIPKIIRAVDDKNKHLPSLHVKLRKCLFFLGVRFHKLLLLTAYVMQVLRKVCLQRHVRG